MSAVPTDAWTVQPSKYWWLIWPAHLTQEQVVQRYRKHFGRDPDRIYSPDESQTPWWWTGWVTREEAIK